MLSGAKHQMLLGVTGSGKTFTIANVIRNVNKPTLVISHNKTLAAQLYAEFKSFFPQQRRRILRQLLRLLPARGLHPAHRHVHREGFQQQRGDRAAAALDHELAVRAARRDRGRQRVVHLRHRQQGGLRGDGHSHPRRAGDCRANNSSRGSWTCNTTATTSSSSAASSACAATRWKLCPAGREDALRVEFFGDEIERHHALRAADRATRSKRSTPSPIFPANNSSRPARR